MTDTNQASELFELCKEVYELFPFWAGTDMIYGKEQDGDWKIMPLTLSIPKRNRIPLYTSDYLLEKLQSWFYDMGASDFGQFSVTILADACIAKVRSHDDDFSEQASADTLLLALLKLTIALSEAGELK